MRARIPASVPLNPNYAFAHDQFAMALAFKGRFDEAIAEATRAIALDPPHVHPDPSGQSLGSWRC